MPPQNPQQPQAPQQPSAYGDEFTQPLEPSRPQQQEDQPTVSRAVPARRWPSHMSRRSILRGVAGAGAVGLAAAGGAGAAVALTRPNAEAAPTNLARPAVMAPMPPSAMAGPLVVYVSDTTTGQLDVFAGTGQVRLKNPALVSQLLRALQ